MTNFTAKFTVKTIKQGGYWKPITESQGLEFKDQDHLKEYFEGKT